MRISDWSSDVCSSDLLQAASLLFGRRRLLRRGGLSICRRCRQDERHRQRRSAVKTCYFHCHSPLEVCPLPLCAGSRWAQVKTVRKLSRGRLSCEKVARSEEHTSELQSLMRISYAVFCL